MYITCKGLIKLTDACICMINYPCINQLYIIVFLQQPNVGHGLLIREVSRSHTMTRYSQWDSSG